ncbi:MAG: type I-B CRISPR-associated endonuclease Cas1b [Desulfitobacteriaceae bacterium]|nr:type I-B CRISPR-associated endonuclease Cas1b [Desulfitobacteriaceae bacterium]MDI6915126.1 type I-B CRISPR-associated endonuclease Cas1b [Desulfitobacteriaceae bacterium]
MRKTLYIFSNGQLRRKDNTIYFESEEGEHKYIPVEDTSELMVLGEVDINKRFLEFCAQKEIVIHYFNYYGYYSGTFYPREHYNSGYMILRQAEHYLNAEARLYLAKQFIYGAARNIRQVLKYYLNRDKDVAGRLEEIEKLSERIENTEDISQLMAIEGNIRDQYYRAFDAIHENAAFVFEGRSKRPPQNEMNTLISFGNGIMYSTVLSEIYHTHLDPRIGYLHTTNFRRFTLNLDVAEIFKPIVVDRTIFTLISKKMISKKDFKKEAGGLLLKESGRRAFVEELENRLKTTINHRDIGSPVSYRRLLRLELYKLEKHLMGETIYEPFVTQW